MVCACREVGAERDERIIQWLRRISSPLPFGDDGADGDSSTAMRNCTTAALNSVSAKQIFFVSFQNLN